MWIMFSNAANVIEFRCIVNALEHDLWVGWIFIGDNMKERSSFYCLWMAPEGGRAFKTPPFIPLQGKYSSAMLSLKRGRRRLIITKQAISNKIAVSNLFLFIIRNQPWS